MILISNQPFPLICGRTSNNVLTYKFHIPSDDLNKIPDADKYKNLFNNATKDLDHQIYIYS
ncbi:hypothetical protein BpHYR1_029632 [Brachionus plicatilis]|uniref:Uncharacterized protein n=1 Tax=Brachionus plicatilis TaxID=10195 RepID=A0A3M7RC64_BRAPC|nr:hypothetical protein BpHYR1_029632 [Brachionus plicatilis]